MPTGGHSDFRILRIAVPIFGHGSSKGEPRGSTGVRPNGTVASTSAVTCGAAIAGTGRLAAIADVGGAGVFCRRVGDGGACPFSARAVANLTYGTISFATDPIDTVARAAGGRIAAGLAIIGFTCTAIAGVYAGAIDIAVVNTIVKISIAGAIVQSAKGALTVVRRAFCAAAIGVHTLAFSATAFMVGDAGCIISQLTSTGPITGQSATGILCIVDPPGEIGIARSVTIGVVLAGAGKGCTFFCAAFIVGAFALSAAALGVVAAGLAVWFLTDICAITGGIATAVLYIVKTCVDGAITGSITGFVKLTVASNRRTLCSIAEAVGAFAS